MEQRINYLEQTQLQNQLEICGVKEEKGENLENIAKLLCLKINQHKDDINKVVRKRSHRQSNKKQDSSIIIVSLREGSRDKWIEAAKSTTINTKDLGREEDCRVFLRETLTPTTAFLLWKAKTDLKENNNFKYVWCKRGTIMARRSEQEPHQIIRSVKDIERLLLAENNEEIGD